MNHQRLGVTGSTPTYPSSMSLHPSVMVIDQQILKPRDQWRGKTRSVLLCSSLGSVPSEGDKGDDPAPLHAITEQLLGDVPVRLLGRRPRSRVDLRQQTRKELFSAPLFQRGTELRNSLDVRMKSVCAFQQGSVLFQTSPDHSGDDCSRFLGAPRRAGDRKKLSRFGGCLSRTGGGIAELLQNHDGNENAKSDNGAKLFFSFESKILKHIRTVFVNVLKYSAHQHGRSSVGAASTDWSARSQISLDCGRGAGPSVVFPRTPNRHYSGPCAPKARRRTVLVVHVSAASANVTSSRLKLPWPKPASWAVEQLQFLSSCQLRHTQKARK